MPLGVPFLLELFDDLQEDFDSMSKRYDALHMVVTTQAQQMKGLVTMVAELVSREPAAATSNPTLLEMVQKVLDCLTALESGISRLQAD